MKTKLQPLLVLVLALSALLLVGGAVFYNLQNAAKQAAQAELSSIATLKSQQIEEWIDDRYSDAQTLGIDSYFSIGVEHWLNTGRHLGTQNSAQIQRQLDAFVVAHRFTSIALFDSQGEMMLQAGQETRDLAHIRSNALHAISAGHIEFIDIHRHDRDEISPSVGFVIPLQVKGKTVGALYFVESASRYLYPLLAQWPTKSKTTETQLMRQEGDQVLFISPLKNRSDPPLTVSFPLSMPELVAAQALRGSTGLIEHKQDYLGQAVLAFAAPIKGTSWVLVTKVTEDEVYSFVHRLWLVAVLATVVLFLGTGLWFRQWQSHVRINFHAREVESKLRAETILATSEKRFRTVFEQAALAMARILPTGEFIEVNEAWCTTFGFKREELIAQSMSWRAITHPDDLQQSQEQVRQLLGGKIAEIKIQKRYLRKDGQTLWGNTEVSLVRNAQGEADYFIVAIQDITPSKLLEEKLAQNLTILKMALDGAQEAVWEWDLLSGKAIFSPEYYTMLGYLPDEFPANQQEWLSRIHPDEREGVMNKIQDELAQHQDIYLAEYRMRTKDGRYRWIQGRGKCIAFDSDGKPLKMVGINMDIHERKQAELQVSYLAYHDKLTALPNRVLFFDRFSQAISLAKRDKLHVALLFADLDGFKQVNDELGHEAGDEVLRMASQRLLACTRAADTLSRFGGDEFALIIGNIDDAQQAAAVAKKIIQAFEVEMTLADGLVCQVGISIGISLYPENGTAMDSLLSAADHAMYSCKRQGKNTYAFFSENPSEGDQWIKFNDTHLTGVAEIDEQHRSLVSAVNRLNSALQSGQEKSVMRAQFDEVIALTAAHFETEGRLMAQSGYPDQRHHEHEHALLVDEAMRLRARLDEGGELLALQIIKDWLLDHIAHSDKPLAKYLISQGLR